MLKQYFRLLLIILGVTLTIAGVYAQEGNPFDLEHKTIDAQKWDTNTEVNLPTAVPVEDTLAGEAAPEPINPAFDPDQIEGNPFEIGKSDQKVDAIKVIPKPVAPKRPKLVIGDADKTRLSRFKIILSIILMVAMALISTLLRHVILKVVEGFRSDNLLRTYFRNIGRRVSLPIFLLELFFVVNAAFACFLFMEHMKILGGTPFWEFLLIFLGISIVVFGKHIVLYIIREVFPIKKEVAEYNFTITLFFSMLGLILMPCNLILAFAPEGLATLSLYFIGIVSVLILGYLAFRAFLIGSKFLSTNRFHFFMYLCTVEIAPLFILVKVIKNLVGS